MCTGSGVLGEGCGHLPGRAPFLLRCHLIFLLTFPFSLLVHAWLSLLSYLPPDFLLSVHCFLFLLFLSTASCLWEAL